MILMSVLMPLEVICQCPYRLHLISDLTKWPGQYELPEDGPVSRDIIVHHTLAVIKVYWPENIAKHARTADTSAVL